MGNVTSATYGPTVMENGGSHGTVTLLIVYHIEYCMSRPYYPRSIKSYVKKYNHVHMTSNELHYNSKEEIDVPNIGLLRAW